MSKYNNKIVYQGKQKFDSKKEYIRYKELCLLERAGEIKDLKRQVKFTLIDKSAYGREIKYIADFTYTVERTGAFVVEDVKSPVTKKNPVYRLKKRLFQERYKMDIVEV